MLRFSKRSPICRYLIKIFTLVFRPIRATFPDHLLSINSSNNPSRGVKFKQSNSAPVHAMKGYRRSRIIAPFTRNLGA